MKFLAALLVFISGAALAALPFDVIKKNRDESNYSLIVRTAGWIEAPHIADGSTGKYLRAVILRVVFENFGKGEGVDSLFHPGDTVLFMPYCYEAGSNVHPGGPRLACADLENQTVQIWANLQDTQVLPGDENNRTLAQIYYVPYPEILTSP